MMVAGRRRNRWSGIALQCLWRPHVCAWRGRGQSQTRMPHGWWGWAARVRGRGATPAVAEGATSCAWGLLEHGVPCRTRHGAHPPQQQIRSDQISDLLVVVVVPTASASMQLGTGVLRPSPIRIGMRFVIVRLLRETCRSLEAGPTSAAPPLQQATRGTT